MRPALLIYCQHSMGLGHLVRSWAIADALSATFRVVFVSGGEPPAGMREHHPECQIATRDEFMLLRMPSNSTTVPFRSTQW